MSNALSAMVFFGQGFSAQELADPKTRLRVLNDGVKAIIENITGINIVKRNNFACAVTVSGSAEAVKTLADYVRGSSIGRVATDSHERPAVRAANGRCRD